MNRAFRYILLLFLTNSVYSQSKIEFQFTNVPLEKVISKIENKFEIKYSYLDSIVTDKYFSVGKNKYSLEEINLEIERQTQLKISQLTSRYYSISTAVNHQKTIQLDEILIESFLVRGIQKTSQKFILSPKKSEILPGFIDSDVFLSLQQLPGVRSPNETATGLHIRGGTPDQNLILLDGIRLFHPGHLFGMISGINPNIVEKVDFYNEATNPKFGERISSVIDLKTSTQFSQKPKFDAGLNSLYGDFFVQLPLLKNKLDVQLSGRKSFTELAQSYTFNQLANKVFQNTDFKTFTNDNTFQFFDYSAKILYQLSPKSLLSFTALSIDNSLNYSNKVTSDANSNQEMQILNNGYSLNWNKKYSEVFSHQLVVHYSIYDFQYQRKLDFNSSTNFEAFKKLNRIINSGAELNFTSVLNSKIALDYGYQISGNDVSHLFNSFNQDLGVDLSSGRLYDIVHAGFTNFTFKNKSWSSQFGIRYNYYSKINLSTFEPRVFIQNKITDAFILQASFERKNQQLSQVRENVANDLSLENYIWVLGDANKYNIQTANQFSTGLIFKKNQWLIDFDVYLKTIDGISNVNFGFINQSENQTNRGNGFTKGLDFFVQKIANDWRTTFTYSYQDSQNRFENLNQNAYFQSNTNNKHAVNFSLIRKWKKFSATMGWFWHTGKPFSVLEEDGTITSLNQKT